MSAESFFCPPANDTFVVHDHNGADGAAPNAVVDATPTAHSPYGETVTTLITDDGHRRVWTVSTVIECTAERHDTVVAYKNHGCRCPAASRAAVSYEKRRRAGHVKPNVPAGPTARRLQALAAIGYGSDHLAPLLNLNPVTVSSVRRGDHDHVTGRTAAAVEKVYQRLSGTPGPSKRTRTYAARHGWAPPRKYDPALWDDIDEVAVQRAMRGEPVDLTRTERLEVVHRLGTGVPVSRVAELLHTDERQAQRYREYLGMTTRRTTDRTDDNDREVAS